MKLSQITPKGMKIFCNPENFQAISEITAMCRNTEVIVVDGYIYKTDRDEAERFKIWSFIKMIQSLSNKNVGIPLTPTSKKPVGSRYEVEKWPLIQAYGHEGNHLRSKFYFINIIDFKTGKFFTMEFQVHKLYHQLEKIYSNVDAQAIKVIANSSLNLFR